MKRGISIIEVPIDFGHTQKGKYIPQGLAQAPAVLAQKLREQLNHVAGPSLKIKIQKPDHQEDRDAPLKYDEILTKNIQDAMSVVASELQKNTFPVILGGDHTVSLVTALSLSQTIGEKEHLGAIVFDAHTDFNLPGPVGDFTPSGNPHGMIHALLSGYADSTFQLATLCKTYSRVLPERIAILGVRTQWYDQLKKTLNKAKPLIIKSEEIKRASPKELKSMMEEVVHRVTDGQKNPFYMSLDCDVLDPNVFSHVSTPVPDGLGFKDIALCLDLLSQQKAFLNHMQAMDLVEFRYEEPNVLQIEMDQLLNLVTTFFSFLS